MDHRPIEQHGTGTVAVLMIHGIAGTPAQFRHILPLIPPSWGIYNILLDGHGGTPGDFGASSMKKWRKQAADVLQELLERYQHVVLVGHSMGTLFAIRAAVEYPYRVPFAFLLAVPTRPWVRFSTFRTFLRVFRGAVREEDRAGKAMLEATSIRLDRKLRGYIRWLPRMVELLSEIRQVRKLLPRLQIPCHTFQSRVDELVSFRSCTDLEGHPCICNTVLEGSGHFQYGPEDIRLLQERFAQLIQQYCAQERGVGDALASEKTGAVRADAADGAADCISG